jgi:hypothetical protein
MHMNLMNLKPLGLWAMMSCLGMSLAFAANGSWTFGTEDQGHPDLSYLETDKTIFMVAAGPHS